MQKSFHPYIAILSLLLGYTSAAQTRPAAPKGTISGKVLDALSKTPIDYASISVFTISGSKPLNGSTTDGRGIFSISGLDTGTYRIVVDFIGYLPDTLTATVKTPSMIVRLENILLAKKAQTLQGVVITAQKPLIENKIDKMVYNAEKDVTAQGGVATDLLKKIPQVSVDADGNVELQGNANIRFLINGKPSSIFGNSLSEALQSIPASQIKTIEVITSPGAKYDAEGTGGIINIVLKDSRIRGINGNINLAAGSRLENGSLNLHARRGHWGVNAFVNGNGQVPSTTIKSLDRSSYDTIQQTHTDLLQHGSSRFHRAGMATGIGVEWDINKRNNLSGNFSYDYFGNEGTGTNYQQLITESISSPGSVISNVNSIFVPDNHFRVKSYDYSLNYKKTFAREEQELTAGMNSSYGNSKQNYTQEQFNAAGDTVFAGLHSINPGRDHSTEIQIDYTQPLATNIKLETGAKTVLRDIQSASDVFSYKLGNPGYHYDSTQSNALHYRRQVYAAYASLTFPIGKWLEVKSGLRYERTQTQADFSKASNVSIPGYNTITPSILLAHHFGETQTLKLSYTRRIQRPDYFLLNPFVNALDPKNISHGNPELKPEKGDNAELGYSKNFEKGGSLNASLFYRNSHDDIQPYITYYPSFKIGDSVYTNVSVNTFENIGTQHVFGFSLYGSVPVGEKLTLRSNLSLFDKYILNRFVENNNVSSFNYRVNLNASYQASKTLVAEFFGNFNSPRNEVQGKYPSFTSYNFAFRKLLWNKKGSIGFTTTNPFNNYVKQETEVYGQQFVLNSLRQIPFRSFGISFSYKFGKLEFKKENEEEENHPGNTETN
ncbi:MAG: TonB-dependent receptor [Paludibacteraceae bacterium]